MADKLHSPKDHPDDPHRSGPDWATKKDLNNIEQRLDKIMALLDDILADVQDEATVVASVVTLLTNLSAALAAAGTDPAKLAAVKTQIDTNKKAMADAIVANTPAAPPTP